MISKKEFDLVCQMKLNDVLIDCSLPSITDYRYGIAQSNLHWLSYLKFIDIPYYNELFAKLNSIPHSSGVTL